MTVPGVEDDTCDLSNALQVRPHCLRDGLVYGVYVLYVHISTHTHTHTTRVVDICKSRLKYCCMTRKDPISHINDLLAFISLKWKVAKVKNGMVREKAL